MKIIDALDRVARYREAWKSKKAWNPPFCYNRDHILRLLGPDKEVDSITKSDLLEMRFTLMDEPGQKKGETRTNGGVNRIMSMVNTLLQDLVELDVLEKAPKIKALKEKNERLTFYTKEQVEKMIRVAKEVFDDQDLSEAIMFAVYTGCRQGEMLRLRVQDLDFDNEKLTFVDTKNGDDHTIDIHPLLKPMLKERTALIGDQCYVFDFENADIMRRRFYRVRDYLGISDDYVWHTLRHSTATWLVEAGVPIQTIADVLNHKVLQTTQRYAKVSNTARKTAIATL